MTFTTTGIGFLFSSLGLGFCGLRFYGSFKRIGGIKSKNRTGLLVSLLFLTMSTQHVLLSVSSFFFIGTPVFSKIIIVVHIVLSLISLLGTYLLVFIFFPKISPLLPVLLTTAVGTIMVVQTILLNPEPTISLNRGINWNFPYSLSINLYYLLLIQIGSIFFVFSRLLLMSKDHLVKAVSFIVMALSFGGIINIFFSFGLPGNQSLETSIRRFDVIMMITGILFITVFLLVPAIVTLWHYYKEQ